MSDPRAALLNTIKEGLASLSPAEFHVFALAVLHGVPVTRLSGDPQENVDVLIGAQKSLRKHMTEAGFGTADLEKAVSKKGR